MKDGKIYTPENIVDLMVDGFELSSLDVLEPSCGDGNFVVKLLGSKKLVAQDIDQDALDKMKKRCGFEGKNEDYLTSDENEKFDLIIGNPPYINIHDLSEDSREEVKKFEVCSSGTVDIYYAFIEKSLKKLNKNGVLKFIIPNTWLINASAKKLRSLLSNYNTHVFDFESEKVFDGVGTYTCILTVKNDGNKNIVVKTKSDKFVVDINNSSDPWVKKPSEKFDFTFKNGLATLCDKAFIFEKKENGKYYSRVLNEFVDIEDEYIKPIVKGSTLEKFYCLYPYDENGKKKKPEETSNAWKYLTSIKDVLTDRDYDDEWWDFGRSQGLKNMSGKKLVISTILSPNKEFKYIETEDLVYSGIFVNENIDTAKKFLQSDNIKNFIFKHGKKMSGGYTSFTKTLFKGIVK